MLVKILNNLSYQKFPITEGMIDIPEEELEEIGKTKQFDVVTGTVIDYERPAVNTEKIAALKEIKELKAKLEEWDYKTCKYVDGDYSEEEWTEIVAQRRAWRDRINELEAQYGIQIA